MKDIAGTEILTDDKVGFSFRRNRATFLAYGYVRGFSSQMVRVEYFDRITNKNITSSKKPDNLMVLYSQDNHYRIG